MEMQVIKEQELLGKQFRMYGDVENPLFLAKDVANWIEHNKSGEMIKKVDEEEKLTAIVSHSGQNREMWMLTEDGLYEVLMTSRKPIAKAFKKEVKLILRSIRKHGAYMTKQTADELINNPDLVIGLANKIKEEKAKNIELAMQKEKLETKVNDLIPMAMLGSMMRSTNDTIKVEAFANLLANDGINMSRNELFKYLRKNKFLTAENRPTQKSVNKKLIALNEGVHYEGRSAKINLTPVITPNGQLEFSNRLAAEINKFKFKPGGVIHSETKEGGIIKQYNSYTEFEKNLEPGGVWKALEGITNGYKDRDWSLI